jgi:hypothetical protein
LSNLPFVQQRCIRRCNQMLHLCIFSGFDFNEPLLMCVPPGKSSDGYKPMVSTTLLSCCLASAFVFYYEFFILYGVILIKLSFPFLSIILVSVI